MKPDEARSGKYVVALLLAITCAGTLPLSANAKTLYVNAATGIDVTTYANNDESHPWKTIGRAAWGSTSYSSPNASQAAQAGDTVQIAAGTYSESGDPSGTRYSVALNPANSGTATNPITFRGVGLVYIRLNAGIRGPMIGCASSRNYITWDHFQIDDYYGGSQQDTGPVVFFQSHHCQLINSDVQGHDGSFRNGYPTYSDNYSAVRYDYADDVVIRNNRIHRVWGTGTAVGSGGPNVAGILSYNSNNGLVEHNEIYDVGEGVWIKGVNTNSTQNRNIIRYNYVHETFSGIRITSGQDTYVYQNIVTRTTEAGLWAGLADSTRSRFVNNTLYGNAKGILAQGTNLVDVQFHNNLVLNNTICGIGSNDVAAPSLQQLTFTRNLYFNNANHAVWNMYGTSTIIPFSTWQTTYHQDINGLNGSDPRFRVNGTDFHLQAASPALTLGVDILDLNNNGSTTDTIPAGAYITGSEMIGLLLSGSTDTTPPATPADLRVR